MNENRSPGAWIQKKAVDVRPDSTLPGKDLKLNVWGEDGS